MVQSQLGGNTVLSATQLIKASADEVYHHLLDPEKWELYNPDFSQGIKQNYTNSLLFTIPNKKQLKVQIIQGISDNIFFCNYTLDGTEWFSETKVEPLNEYTIVKMQVRVPPTKNQNEIKHLMLKNQSAIDHLKVLLEDKMLAHNKKNGTY